MSHFTFTSESVSEGHPDKVCDYISDSVLDACLEQDKFSRVACETLVKSDYVVLAGEITTNAKLDYEKIVRQAVKEIGYTDIDEPFCDTTLKVMSLITRQSNEIDQGVTSATSQSGDQGAGDQGIMFGYASDESDELMPLPIVLAHKLTFALAADRKAGKVDFLRPDSKSQVSVAYDGNTPKQVTCVVVSTQHTPSADQKRITEYVREDLGPRALGNWWRNDVQLFVNPTGSFTHGGPSADAGVTGRKIIVDSYGGWGRHGGGAFSGKDPVEGRSQLGILLPLRRAPGDRRRPREEGGDSGRLRHRHGQAGVGEGRHLRHGRRCGSREVRDGHLRLPPAHDHRTAEPAAAHLPADHELRPLRPHRSAVGRAGRRRGEVTPPNRATESRNPGSGTPRVTAPPIGSAP